jgi:hypothetical protein
MIKLKDLFKEMSVKTQLTPKKHDKGDRGWAEGKTIFPKIKSTYQKLYPGKVWNKKTAGNDIIDYFFKLIQNNNTDEIAFIFKDFKENYNSDLSTLVRRGFLPALEDYSFETYPDSGLGISEDVLFFDLLDNFFSTEQNIPGADLCKREKEKYKRKISTSKKLDIAKSSSHITYEHSIPSDVYVKLINDGTLLNPKAIETLINSPVEISIIGKQGEDKELNKQHQTTLDSKSSTSDINLKLLKVALNKGINGLIRIPPLSRYNEAGVNMLFLPFGYKNTDIDYDVIVDTSKNGQEVEVIINKIGNENINLKKTFSAEFICGHNDFNKNFNSTTLDKNYQNEINRMQELAGIREFDEFDADDFKDFFDKDTKDLEKMGFDDIEVTKNLPIKITLKVPFEGDIIDDERFDMYEEAYVEGETIYTIKTTIGKLQQAIEFEGGDVDALPYGKKMRIPDIEKYYNEIGVDELGEFIYSLIYYNPNKAFKPKNIENKITNVEGIGINLVTPDVIEHAFKAGDFEYDENSATAVMEVIQDNSIKESDEDMDWDSFDLDAAKGDMNKMGFANVTPETKFALTAIMERLYVKNSGKQKTWAAIEGEVTCVITAKEISDIVEAYTDDNGWDFGNSDATEEDFIEWADVENDYEIRNTLAFEAFESNNIISWDYKMADYDDATEKSTPDLPTPKQFIDDLEYIDNSEQYIKLYLEKYNG